MAEIHVLEEMVDTVKLIETGLEKLSKDDTADFMAQLLMDPDHSTWKMYEDIARRYLNPSRLAHNDRAVDIDSYRAGLNDALIYLTGWSIDTITHSMLVEYTGNNEEEEE